MLSEPWSQEMLDAVENMDPELAAWLEEEFADSGLEAKDHGELNLNRSFEVSD